MGRATVLARPWLPPPSLLVARARPMALSLVGTHSGLRVARAGVTRARTVTVTAGPRATLPVPPESESLQRLSQASGWALQGLPGGRREWAAGPCRRGRVTVGRSDGAADRRPCSVLSP